MNNTKKLYESPAVEEIVFASMDAIALSESEKDPDNGFDDSEFGTVGNNL